MGRYKLFAEQRRVNFILSEQDCLELEKIAAEDGDSMTSVMRRFVRSGIQSTRDNRSADCMSDQYIRRQRTEKLEQDILYILQGSDPATVNEIAARMQLNAAPVRNVLTRMARRGKIIVERVNDGSRRLGYKVPAPATTVVRGKTTRELLRDA
jgi:AraC-like DNA-binding protein